MNIPSMRTWNHRVILRSEAGEETRGIHEVFYDEDGHIVCWTENPIGVLADSSSDLATLLGRLQRAFQLPHLVEVEGTLKEAP